MNVQVFLVHTPTMSAGRSMSIMLCPAYQLRRQTHAPRRKSPPEAPCKVTRIRILACHRDNFVIGYIDEEINRRTKA